MPFYVLPVAIVLYSFISAVSADPTRLEQVVVTATHIPAPKSSFTSMSSIITADEIAARQAATATDLLRQLSGVNVIQQGGRGGNSSIVLRGGEANFTLVLIDGVKVNDPTNTRGGSYDFSSLDVDSIERIEVVRGPMSAVYGSDALAGVINIITKTANGEESQQQKAAITLSTGNEGYRKLSAETAGKITDNMSVSLGISSLGDDEPVEANSFENWNVHGKLKAKMNQSELTTAFRYMDSESRGFPEDSGGPRLAVLRETDQKDATESQFNVNFSHPIAGGSSDLSTDRQWITRFSASLYQRKEDAISPGIAPGVIDPVPPNGAKTDFTRSSLSATASSKITDNFEFLVGTEWQREEGDSDGFLDVGIRLPTTFSLDRRTTSLFVEGRYTLGALLLNTSVRHDNPDQFDSETTAQFGVLYPFANQATQLRFNAGESYKLPSFFALGHPLVGNADLKPETAQSYDIGITHAFRQIAADVSLTVFRNKFKDLIDFDPEAFTNVNRSEVISKGVELTANYDFSDAVSMTSHLTWSESEIRDSDSELRGRPEWRGGIGLNWIPKENWRVYAGVLYLDEFFESSVPTGQITLDGYTRVDTTISWQMSKAFRLSLAIDNLTDEDYEEAVGFPAAGIRARFSAKYRF